MQGHYEMEKNKNKISEKENLQHVEADPFSQSQRTDNPISSSAFNVVVSIPDNLEIKMVEANALGEYEIWIFISSIVSNFAIGFFVSYIQEAKSESTIAGYVGWTTIAFFLLLLISLIVAISKRNGLKRKGKKIALKTSGAEVTA